jgi:hypothetical protein
MKARILFHNKIVELDGGIIEVKIWVVVPTPDRPYVRRIRGHES